MESRRPLVARRRSNAPVHLSFSPRQRDHFRGLRLRRECFTQQKMSRATHRFVSCAQKRVDGRKHAHTPPRIPPKPQTLCSGGVSEPLPPNRISQAPFPEKI